MSPEAYESMTGAKPEPSATAPDPAASLSNEADSGPLWHIPIRYTHALPKLPYDSAHKPSGPRKVMSKKYTNPDNIRATNGENEAADVMARYGHQIEQIKESDKIPDLKINDMPDKADVYSPASASSLKNIRSTIRGKVEGQNAPYVVILLQPGDNSQSIKDLTEFMKKNPVNGLKQLFVVKEGKLYTLQ